MTDRYPDSPALGNFYVVTDGDTHTHPEGYGYFWDEVDKAVIKVFGEEQSLWKKMLLPYWFLIVLAHICDVVGYLAGIKLKLNPFNVNVLVMHRWFDTSAAEKDLKVPHPEPLTCSPGVNRCHRCLKPASHLPRTLFSLRSGLCIDFVDMEIVLHFQYKPVIGFGEGWQDMTDWFIANWLPGFRQNGRAYGLAKQSEEKINIQAKDK